ncbi:antibiotic biosynthesis monooxygenase [Burkholderia cenocepacia]|uniref:putative quinol monooxygenase n=1 Tax=Burkholderia cenocepacia TaxID=95486 RepID=UPI002874F807|nr:antibiotic biosynthesis monooxygenase [Burkholderia cenocepacia]MDS0848468.1 antibiotic biosynthesis monooxygenase [Burkholderia cenocepacia]
MHVGRTAGGGYRLKSRNQGRSRFGQRARSRPIGSVKNGGINVHAVCGCHDYGRSAARRDGGSGAGGRGSGCPREDGCEKYELHRHRAAFHRFTMVERWRDEHALNVHGMAPAFQTLSLAALEGKATLDVVLLEKLI